MRSSPRIPLLFAGLLALFLSACSTPPPAAKDSSPPGEPGPVARHGALRVERNRIVDAHGQPFAVAGISYGWSQWEAARFYNPNVVEWLKQDWHTAIIRAPLGIHEEDGYFQHPKENKERVLRVIDAALAAGLYVIVDWHDHHAHEHAEQAIAFFTDIARRYGKQPNLIYEIYNEPKDGYTWARDVKPYSEKVVAAIRAIDPDNLIIIGTPNWSQDVDIAAADPVAGTNLAYTLHFYAATHKEKLREKARVALQRGAALFITEWGTCEASGAGPIDEASVQAWLDFMREHQLSHCNWAVYDKKETAALVLPTAASEGGWSDADLTPSGRYVRNLVRAWNGATP